MPVRPPTDRLLLLTLYVLPVAAAAAYLVRVGLGVLAAALVVVEAVVATSVWAAKSPPARPARAPRPWLVPAVLLLSLVGMVVLTLAVT